MAIWDDITGFLSNNSGQIGAAAVGGLLGSQSGAKQSGTSTSTTAPWGPQQPYLQDIFARAQQQSLQPATNGLMGGALTSMVNSVNNPLQGQAQGVISNTLNQDPAQTYGIGQKATLGQNPYLGQDNPYLKSSINTASEDAMRNLMPAFDQASQASGSFGNSGVSDAFGRAAGSALGNIATNARMGDYQTQQGLTNQNLTTQAGFDQQGINNNISQYNQGNATLNNAAFNAPGFNAGNIGNYGQLYNAGATNQQAQWQPLQNYSALTSGGYGGSSSSPIYSNPTASALGGAVAGSQVYSSLFGNK